MKSKLIQNELRQINDNMMTHRTKRNYGIDLLKIIAMVNIINLHICNQKIFYNLNPQNLKYKHVQRLKAFSYWPVNAFGLISGIVGYKKYKFINIIYIWFIYSFYSIFFFNAFLL